MGTRVGIELSPVDCRIVEIDCAAGAFAAVFPASGSPAAGAETTRVRAYSVSPRVSTATRKALARLRGREAAVVAWGLRGDHRQTVVRADEYDVMRAEAIDSLRFAGIDTRGVFADIAPAGPRQTQGRRPVVTAVAPRRDVAAAISPLTAAGIRVRSVVTPAAALGSVARLRRGRGAMPGIEAYVALEQTATCIALVRDQILAAARELPWGYVNEHEPFGERVPRDKIAVRLAGELADFFSAAGIEVGQVNSVCICGSLPELRTMTVPIMERLDVEIEPLDSMFGIDAGQLPKSVVDLPERAVEIRLAWAAAADWSAPLNLLRDRQRRAAAAALSRAAVIAGVGAGVGLGWGLQQTAWLEAAGHARPGVGVARQGARSLAAVQPAAEPSLPVAEPTLPTAEPAPPPARREPPAASAEPIAPRASIASDARPPAIVREPAAAAPIETPPVMHEPVVQPRLRVVEREVVEREQGPITPRTRPPAASRPASRPVASGGAPLVVGSILFGPERKLAIIEGRIVEAGDEVRGSVVVDIAPTSVTLRDADGRLRKFPLGRKGP
jgi:hypothetical protein